MKIGSGAVFVVSLRQLVGEENAESEQVGVACLYICRKWVRLFGKYEYLLISG